MFSLIRALTFRYLKLRLSRSILVALSIALGVATLVSARLLNQFIEAAAYDSTAPADAADLYVNNGEIGVDWKVFEDVRKVRIPGLDRVEPFVIDRIMLPDLADRSANIFGADFAAIHDAKGDAKAPKSNPLKITFQVVANPLALLGKPVALSRRLYEQRRATGKGDLDPVLIKYTNESVPFNLVAIIDVPKDSPVAPFADSLVVADVREVAKLIHRPGEGGDARITRVDLYLEPGADPLAVQAAVAEIVGPRGKVRTPEENRKSTDQVVGGVKIVLNLCSFGALIVGLFLVYNALSVTVTERRHDIGVLRSLGATRWQIAQLFAIEAMILGFLGSLPGIPLGVLLANTAVNTFGDEMKSVFLNSESPPMTLDLTTTIAALTAGIITALLAALIPAMQAASDEPADAVRRSPGSHRGPLWWFHRSMCVVLVLAGFAAVASRKSLPDRYGSTLGMMSILTGLFLAMPILVALLARSLNPIFRIFLGIEARLAADNLLRSPARTGVVIGALAAGVSLMFQTAGVGKSNEVPIREWLNQVIQADAFLFRGNLASANSSMSPMDPKLRAKLQAIPGVDRVVGLRFFRPEYNGTYVLVLALDASDYNKAVRERLPVGLPKLDLFEQLPKGKFALVSDNFAAKWKVSAGDKITLPGPKGPLEFEVLGNGQDYSWNQGTIFVDRALFTELFDDRYVDNLHVFFKNDADVDATYERIRQFAEQEQLQVQDRASVRLYLAGLIERLFQVAYVQQIIIAVVAALGVVTALLISVLQRRRELGLLRAVGATQPQVIKTVIAEATLMGFFGTILGFALGLPLEWFLLKVVLWEESGFDFDLLIPWKESLGIGLIAVLASTIAGLIPALHAVKMRITDAIAYE
jgi:putative ABC transport system permease protein